MLTTLKWE